MTFIARALFSVLLLSPFPASAMIGGLPAPEPIAVQTALIVSTRGASCTGAVLSRDLVLTAAHCVQPQADYAIVVFEHPKPRIIPVIRVELHPRFDPAHFKTRRPTPDLALVKVAMPLPGRYRPVYIERTPVQPQPGERFLLVGYGVTEEGDGKSAGRLHTVILPAIGNTIDATGVIMVRLSESGGKNSGACTGDSGGPVFRSGDLAAVIGWSTGRDGRGCGAVTGATLVAPQFEWIAKTAHTLGSSLGE